MADEGTGVTRIMIDPATVKDCNVLRKDSEVQVFYHRDFGTFWSFRADLSDLGGPYLSAARECVRARGAIV
jgi:hypothetical protein